MKKPVLSPEESLETFLGAGSLAVEQAKSEDAQGNTPVKLNKKGMRIGRWSAEEHERFLEALRIYGKDWSMIQSHVKTRDVTNIRAHA